MRFRTTLLLAGVLALLSLTYYFLELKEVEKQAGTKLASFEEKEVTGVSIRRGEKVIALSKDEGGWRMSLPADDRGDEKEITALIGNVTRAKIERTLKATGDHGADFGLQDPAIVLTVHLKEKEQPFVLEIGSDTPAGFSVYARRKGEDKVLLAPGTLKTFLEKEPFAFRSKVPLLFDREAVRGLSLRTDSLRARLEQQQKETWRITEPIQGKADSRKVSDLVHSLSQDQVTAFLDKPPADLKGFGLAPPRGEIRLTLEGGAEATLLFGAQKKEGGVYARRQGEERVLELTKEFFTGLPKKVEDVRDRTLLAFDREKVQQIDLKGPKGQTLLKKMDGKWKMKEPEEASADHRLIEDLLWDLAGARIKAFVSDKAKSLKPYGLDAPAIVIRLLDQEAKPLTTLALNQAKKRKGAYARIDDTQEVFLVEARLYDQLAKGPFDLRLRRLLSFETWDVGQVELSRDGTTILLEKRREHWQVRKPREARARYAAVSDLLNEARNLKWDKVIATTPADLDRYGLAPPAITLSLAQEDGKPIGTVLFGKTEGDLVFVKVNDRPEVYAVRATFLKSIPTDSSALLE